MTITYQQWGLHRGQAVYLFQLVHQNGGRVQLTNYGASIVSVQAPDRRGQAGEVVLGFASLEGFLQDRCYLGATIGRVANRIAGAQFSLDGIWYTLDANDGVHSNHSGPTGLHGKVFGFRVEDDALLFHTRCADGEGGFPGRLDVTVRYRWSADYRLEISYEAVTSRDTIVNITNHAYFNLSGARGAMLDHTLTIPACRLLEADSAYIPTGRLLPAGRKDFREATRISDKAGPGAYQVKGLNDYYLLDTPAPESRQELALAAVLAHPASGRSLQVYTTYPGLMVYTADHLSSEIPGLLGDVYRPFDGICLECQHYPDAPHHADFPSVLLRPGSIYHEQIVYHFKQDAPFPDIMELGRL